MKLFVAVVALAVAFANGAKADEICFPPIAEYYNYWSGEQLTEIDLEGSKWDVAKTVKFINLWDEEELPTYTVYVSRFGKAEAEHPEFYVDEFVYTREDLEYELDAGHLD